MNNAELRDILRRRYPAAEYALLEEVRDKAGFYASRSADYVVMNLWPSRGLYLSGIELKSSRSDWLSEMKKPEKAENIFQYCDFFWLLTENDTIAKLDEIPMNWGWMAIKGGKVFVKKDAPKLEPKPISRHFLGALLKRACDRTDLIHISTIEDRIQKAREAARNEDILSMNRMEKKLAETTKILKDFREASGIDLIDYYRWATNPTKIGEAVKFLQSGGAGQVRKDLLALQSKAQDILINLTKQLHNLHEQQEPTNGTPGDIR